VDEQIFVSAVWLDEAKTFLAIPIADGSLRASRAWSPSAASVAASPATWTTSASATAFDLHVFGARLALLLIDLLVEDDPVSGLQDLGAIALVLPGKVREVHEHVLATAVGLDEAEAFLLIISQDGASCPAIIATTAASTTAAAPTSLVAKGVTAALSTTASFAPSSSSTSCTRWRPAAVPSNLRSWRTSIAARCAAASLPPPTPRSAPSAGVPHLDTLDGSPGDLVHVEALDDLLRLSLRGDRHLGRDVELHGVESQSLLPEEAPERRLRGIKRQVLQLELDGLGERHATAIPTLPKVVALPAVSSSVGCPVVEATASITSVTSVVVSASSIVVPGTSITNRSIIISPSTVTSVGASIGSSVTPATIIATAPVAAAVPVSSIEVSTSTCIETAEAPTVVRNGGRLLKALLVHVIAPRIATIASSLRWGWGCPKASPIRHIPRHVVGRRVGLWESALGAVAKPSFGPSTKSSIPLRLEARAEAIRS